MVHTLNTSVCTRTRVFPGDKSTCQETAVELEQLLKLEHETSTSGHPVTSCLVSFIQFTVVYVIRRPDRRTRVYTYGPCLHLLCPVSSVTGPDSGLTVTVTTVVGVLSRRVVTPICHLSVS